MFGRNLSYARKKKELEKKRRILEKDIRKTHKEYRQANSPDNKLKLLKCIKDLENQQKTIESELRGLPKD